MNATAPQLDSRANPAADARIDELLAPLRTIAEARLDIELGERLRQIVPACACSPIPEEQGWLCRRYSCTDRCIASYRDCTRR